MSEPPLHVLVLEDDFILTMALMLQANPAEFTIVCVKNLPECMDAIQKSSFDWILLDIQLKPHPISWHQIIAKIQSKFKKTIKFIAVTSNQSAQHLHLCQQDGFETTIGVPVELKKIYNKLRQIKLIIK